MAGLWPLFENDSLQILRARESGVEGTNLSIVIKIILLLKGP